MVDLRRVQKTGGSTLIISLPKRWAEATGTKSGDTLSIMPGDRNTLIIDPHPTDKPVKRVKKLTIEDDDPRHFFRRLIAAYICGFDTIEVTAARSISPEMRAAIRNFTRMVIGPEITEEDINSVLIKDLSDSEGFGLKNAFNAFIQGDVPLANRTIDRAEDLEELTNNGISTISSGKSGQSVAIAGMMGSVRRTGMYASDIAEIAINNQINLN